MDIGALLLPKKEPEERSRMARTGVQGKKSPPGRTPAGPSTVLRGNLPAPTPCPRPGTPRSLDVPCPGRQLFPMPTLPPGTVVALGADLLRSLAYPPPPQAVLLVAVHPLGLRAPGSPHTQLVGFLDGEICWAGALSEYQLEVLDAGGGDPRQLLAERLGVGTRGGEVLWPGELCRSPLPPGPSTLYRGERPWVVLGETVSGTLLSAPLNEAGNPKWYTPLVSRKEVLIPASTKDAQVELAHLWSFPPNLPRHGRLVPEAWRRVLEAARAYF